MSRKTCFVVLFAIALASNALAQSQKSSVLPTGGGKMLLDPNDTVLLLLDHQSGLFQTVKDIPVDDLRRNVVMLTRLATLMKIPVITTASEPNGTNGPIMPEIAEYAPKATYVPRKGEVNAWDNEDFVKTVQATGRKTLINGFRKTLVENRAQFFLDLPSGPFYGYNRPDAKPSEGVIRNWWRQGMMGGAKAHYDCIKAFSETDFTDDLKAIDVPTLVMHGEDDQIVPIDDSARLSIKLLKKGTLKTYPGFPHGMATTNPEVINADLLSFIRGHG